VLSISWLQDDLLLTYSAPALMRKYPYDAQNKETYLEQGELIIWRWLGVDRYFPPNHEGVPPTVLRGCSSDYQESSSFQLISIHAFPTVPTQFIVPSMSLFQSPTHDPLVVFVYPGSKDFVMLNLSHLSPRKKPPFPVKAENFQTGSESGGGTLASATERLHIDGEREDRNGNENAESTGEQEKRPALLNARAEVVPPPLVGWELGIDDLDEKTLCSCALGADGRMIVGVGSKGSLWVWRGDIAKQT